jgi:hypothetical protein
VARRERGVDFCVGVYIVVFGGGVTQILGERHARTRAQEAARKRSRRLRGRYTVCCGRDKTRLRLELDDAVEQNAAN